jgi:predicted O-methyltransferase YrrM
VPPLHSDAVGELLRRVGPPPDDVPTVMTARADREGFPTVDPGAGRALALRTGLVGARSAPDPESGFGHSACRIARALPPGGAVTPTDPDAALLDDARSSLERGGLDDPAAFEHGDPPGVAEARDGPVDPVLLDHDTPGYVRGFGTVRDLVRGGAVPRTTSSPPSVSSRRRACWPRSAAGPPRTTGPDRTGAVAGFLDRVRDDPAFETTLLPVDEGPAVARRVD